MKRRIEKEYFCQVQKIFKSKMNGGNMVQAINNLQSSGNSVICGRNGVVDKNIRATDCGQENAQIDDSMSFLHLQADIDRLYFKRSVVGRGFMNAEDSVE